MSAELLLTWNVELTEGGYLPTVVIWRNEQQVFVWRCPFAFGEQASALIYARDYGEVAMEALRARESRSFGP